MNTRNRLSKPANKVRNALIDFLDKTTTQEFIKKMREGYSIPKEGFIFKEGYHDSFPREGWIITMCGAREANFKKEESADIREELYKLMKSSVSNFPISLVEFYFYYNELPQDLNYLSGELENGELCSFIDAGEEFKKYNPDEGTQHLESYKITISDRMRRKPLALFFSPFATKNDILETFNTMKDEILVTQEKYRKELTGSKKLPSFTKSRARNINLKAIKDFIYENRKTNSKMLASMVNDKFQKIYSYSEINKIISTEVKKRS